jgi:hypothetical protein
MATTTIKRLGAIASSGVIGTADTLYTTPAATGTVVSTITVCNTSASSATFTISVSTTTSFVAAGYIVYQATVAGNDTVALTMGVTLDATNKYLLCSASASTVSFSAFGTETA